MSPTVLVCLALLLAAAGAGLWLAWRAYAARRMSRREEEQERKAAEQARQESETRFRTLIEKAPVAISITRDEVRIYANPKFAKMFGYERPEELVGRPVAEQWSPEAEAMIRRYSRQRLLGQPVPEVYEGMARRKDGTLFPVEVAASVISLPDGPATIGFLSDITERKRAERELGLINRLYALLSRVNESVTRSRSDRELFQTTCDAAVTQGGFKLAWVGLVNFATKEVLPAALAGKVTSYLEGIKIYADERPEGQGPMGICIRTGQPYICNDFAKDARFRPWLERAQEYGVNASATLPLYAGGKVIGALAIYHDAVDCFHGEEAALLLEISNGLSFALDNLATRQRASRLSRAVEQSPVSIVITDVRGNIEYVNPKFAQVTGYSPAEVMGKNPRILKADETTAEQARQYQELWATILAGKEWRGEFHNRKKNGELFWESASISPLTDPDGRVTHFLAVKEDVTKDKLLAEEFRHVQKMEAFGRLAAGVAHDFNNLLTAIMGNLELVKLDGPLPPAQDEALTEIGKSAERAANLTRQLLLFSRRKPMQAKIHDLNEVVANVSKLLRRLIGEHIELQDRPYFGDLPVLADAGMLEQLLMNLCVNARDAMPKGGKLTIQTTAETLDEARPGRRAGRFVRLSVSDSGCGIPPEVRAHIFEPFFTTKDVGKGTGLGLATVFGIVEQHKGWIEVETEVGRGTTFHAYLPHHEAQPDPKSVPAAKPREPGGTETILLVEDDASVRGLARTLLQRRGYRIYEADSPMGALEIWAQHQPEIALLFTDMIMPGQMNGLDLSRRLREDKPGLKVVYTSGYNEEMLRENSTLRNAANFLQKPYPAEALLRTIRAELDKGAT